MTALVLRCLVSFRLACTGMEIFLAPLAPLIAPGRPAAPEPAAFVAASGGAAGFVPSDCILYVTQPGDTLPGLSELFGISLADLAAVNQIALDSPLAAGRDLLIPPIRFAAPLVSSVPPAPAVAPAPESPAAAPGDSTDGVPGGGDTDFCIPYVVMEGDTLDLVADAFAVSRDALISANRLPTGARLQPGQRIVIPPP